MISLVKTTLDFKTRENALRFHIYAISFEEGLFLSPREIDVAVELYIVGYNDIFFKSCVDKGFYKSEQTVRNCISKLTKCGLLLKKRGNRKINPKFLPEGDDFIFNYQVKYDLQK